MPRPNVPGHGKGENDAMLKVSMEMTMELTTRMRMDDLREPYYDNDDYGYLINETTFVVDWSS